MNLGAQKYRKLLRRHHGQFDGAEIWGLLSIHILSLLSNKLDKQSTGLYGDNELLLLRNTSKQKADRI